MLKIERISNWNNFSCEMKSRRLKENEIDAMRAEQASQPCQTTREQVKNIKGKR